MENSADPFSAKETEPTDEEEDSKSFLELFLENGMQIGYFLAVCAIGYIVYSVIQSESFQDLAEALGDGIAAVTGLMGFFEENPWAIFLIVFAGLITTLLTMLVKRIGSPARYFKLNGIRRVLLDNKLAKRLASLKGEYDTFYKNLTDPNEKKLIKDMRERQYTSTVPDEKKNLKTKNNKVEAMKELSESAIADIEARGRQAFEPGTQNSSIASVKEYQILQARTTIETAEFAKERLLAGEGVELKGLEAMIQVGEMDKLFNDPRVEIAGADAARIQEFRDMANFAKGYIRISNNWTALAIDKKVPPMDHIELLQALRDPKLFPAVGDGKNLSEMFTNINELNTAINATAAADDVSASTFYEKFKGAGGSWAGKADGLENAFKRSGPKLELGSNVLDFKIKLK